MLPLCRELELSGPFHSLFPAFLGDPFPIFLESSLVHPRLGRYSYMVSDPFLVIQSKNGLVRITGRGVDETRRDDPFEVLRLILSHHRIETVPDLPPFQGGAVGYFGYDLAHHTERLPRTTLDDVAIPDLVVGLYDWTLAHDHGSGRTWIVSVPTGPGGQARAEARMEEVANRVLALARREGGEGDSSPQRHREHGGVREREERGDWGGLRIESNFTRDGYVRAVQRAKEYIAAGDIYQVNLSQRLQAPLAMTPWSPLLPTARGEPGALRGLPGPRGPRGRQRLAGAVPPEGGKCGGDPADQGHKAPRPHPGGGPPAGRGAARRARRTGPRT